MHHALGPGRAPPLGMRLWIALARLFGIALAVGLFASATATMAGTSSLYDVPAANPLAARRALVDDEDAAPADPDTGSGELARRKRAREAAVTTILGHNPFCTDCPDASLATPPEGGPAGSPPATAGPPPVEVLATMEALDPTQSLATIYAPGRGTWAAGVGDSLAPGVLVAAIGPGQLTYARGEATGVLRVGTEPAAQPPAPTPTQPDAPGDEPPTAGAQERVQCDANHRCTIERGLIDDLLANPSGLGGMRAFPTGEGFKIAGVRRGSLGYSLGLRNGDVLTEVAGKTISSIDDALALLPLLRSASNLNLTLSRKGQPITHEIDIV